MRGDSPHRLPRFRPRARTARARRARLRLVLEAVHKLITAAAALAALLRALL